MKTAIPTIARLSSMFLSFGILSLLIRNLTISDFSRIQVLLGVLGICLWALDFGSANLLILNHGKSKTSELHGIFLIRLIISSGVLIVITLSVSLTVGFSTATLLFALWSDLSLETLNNFRQVSYKPGLYFLTVTGRKFYQFISILLLTLASEISLNKYSIILILSSVIVNFVDIRQIGPTWSSIDFRLYFTGKWIWFQSGGSSLAGLDVLVINNGLASVLLPTLAVGKRISNSLGFIGGVLAPESMLLSARSGSLNLKNLKKVILGALVTLFFSAIIFIFENQILGLIMGSTYNTNYVWIIRAFLIALPIGIITSSLNSVLIGLGLFKQASVTTYLSTFVYLGLISVGILSMQITTFLTVAIIMNLLIELSLQIVFLALNERKRSANAQN
jgi:hypothetical protein